MRHMPKIAVMGGRETVIGFKALGLDIFPVANGAEAHETLHRLTHQSEGEYAIIYIEETTASEIMSDIAKFKDKPSPAIILIPGRDGPIGLGQTALQEAVEKAVGSDIL